MSANNDSTRTSPVHIYALVDPETDGVRYVGKSVNPRQRLNGHISNCLGRKTHSHHWLAGLRLRGLKPKLIILETTDADGWPDAERRWIAYYRNAGVDLTNTTEGGDCPEFPPEMRAKMSAAKKGKPMPHLRTPEAIANNAAARTGHKRAACSEARRAKVKESCRRYHDKNTVSDETREKIAAAKRGKPRPRSVIEAMAKANTGRVQTEEQKARRSASLKAYYAEPENRRRLSQQATRMWSERWAKENHLGDLQDLSE